MDRRELMVGNYVYQIGRNTEIHMPIEVPMQISQIRLFDIEVNGFNVGANKPKNINLSDLSPIPLTEDILIRCGFKKHKCGISGADMWQGMDGWSLDDNEWLLRGNPKNGLRLVGYFNTQIFHLHALQNLIWIICKQKITLK